MQSRCTYIHGNGPGFFLAGATAPPKLPDPVALPEALSAWFLLPEGGEAKVGVIGVITGGQEIGVAPAVFARNAAASRESSDSVTLSASLFPSLPLPETAGMIAEAKGGVKLGVGEQDTLSMAVLICDKGAEIEASNASRVALERETSVCSGVGG